MRQKARRHYQVRPFHRRVWGHFGEWSHQDIFQTRSMLDIAESNYIPKMPREAQQPLVFSVGVSQALNTCPVCGYPMGFPPEDYNICPCCGTEFGYSDSGVTHSVLRDRWLKRGATWWSPNVAPPDGWEPMTQLWRNLGVLPQGLLLISYVGEEPHVERLNNHLAMTSAQFIESQNAQ